MSVGYAGEFMFAGCRPPSAYRPWTSGDYMQAFDYASRYWAEPQEAEVVRRAVVRGERKSHELLAQPEVWSAVSDLAARLETRLMVGDDEVYEVLEERLGFGWLRTGERAPGYAD
jgi:hypothetical protein